MELYQCDSARDVKTPHSQISPAEPGLAAWKLWMCPGHRSVVYTLRHLLIRISAVGYSHPSRASWLFLVFDTGLFTQQAGSALEPRLQLCMDCCGIILSEEQQAVELT